MPTITKQVANPKKQPSQNGTILSRAVPVQELQDDFINIVIYGQNRVGKTTLACGNPEIPGSGFPKPLLLISFDPGLAGGARSVKRIPGVTFLHITSSNDARQLAVELRGDTTFKTHVIDTVTSCQDMVLTELLGLEDVPVQLNWGIVSQETYRERSEKTREVLRPFADLRAHTVFLAQEKDHNPPEGRNKLTKGLRLESFMAADLGQATVKWMHDRCDYIGRLYVDKETKTIKKTSVIGNGALKKTVVKEEEVETGRTVRRLLTQLQTNFAAGFRSENPSKVPLYIEEPTFAKILAVIQGK